MISPQRSETCGEHKNVEGGDNCNYEKAKRLQRAQWLRAGILGASDGLVSTASLMLGIGAAQEDRRSMILSGLAGALAGAFSMAVGEFVSVSTQRDIEKATLTVSSKPEPQDHAPANIIDQPAGDPTEKMSIPEDNREDMVFTRPYEAAAASAVSFLLGSSVPLVPVILITQYVTRMVVILAVTTMGLASCGGFGAYLGGSPIRLSAVRAMVGGWIAMSITYGLLKPFDNDNL